MTAPAGDPAYDPDTWKAGYQGRQVGIAGPSVFQALTDPPDGMEDAILAPHGDGDTPPAQGPEVLPPYN